MHNIVKKLVVSTAAAGTTHAITRNAKAKTGEYPSPVLAGLTALGAVAALYVSAFVERKLNLHD
jgi:hypothetical protein